MTVGHIRHQKMNFLSFEEIMGGIKVDGDVFRSASPNPLKVAQEQEIYDLVLEAVNSLSPKNRTTVLLFYFEQLTVYEIAALLNISATAVKGRLYKARKQLKDKLLPLYLEDSSVILPYQNNTMIEVTVADAVFSPSIAPKSCVVILWDEAKRRFLPIFVGIPSGEAIANILAETPLARPMTLQFMSNMLEAADVSLDSVRVDSLENNTYYAVASLSCNGQVKEVDSRPSDAIALALLTNSPIYVNEAVMNEAAIKTPPDVKGLPTGRGLIDFKNEYDQKRQKKEDVGQSKQSKEKNWQAIKEEAIKFLFNRD